MQHDWRAGTLNPHGSPHRPVAALRPTIRIDPSLPSLPALLGELWRYRALLRTFVWRDLTLRYKETAVGAAWAVLQPLLLMIVFSVFLGYLVRVPSDGVAYPVFVYTGLLLWQLFAKAVMQASLTLKDNESIIGRVYFPRLILPLAVIAGATVDFLIALLVLLPLMAYFGIVPGWAVLTMPLFVAMALLSALAVGLWLCALDARYRDLRQVLPVLLQLWLFLTPVIYPISLVPEAWRLLYALNPLVGAVEGLRWALLATPAPPAAAVLAVSTLATLAVLLGGLVYFRRVEPTIVDDI